MILFELQLFYPPWVLPLICNSKEISSFTSVCAEPCLLQDLMGLDERVRSVMLVAGASRLFVMGHLPASLQVLKALQHFLLGWR